MKNWLAGLIVFVLLFVFVYWSLISGYNVKLNDWYDYPYIVWIIGQNIDHIKHLNWAAIFETNAFSPHRNTLFFSDLLFPQALIGLVVSWFTTNILAIFNIVFILTFVLNYLSSFAFWKSIWDRPEIAFVASIITVFSPYYYMEKSHFQMISFWPLMLALYTLRKRKYIWSGILTAIQFVASAYLGIFALTIIGLYVLIVTRKENGVTEMIMALSKIVIIFVILTFPFLLGYRSTQKLYNIKRPYQEYVIYSAHISDYLFTEKIDSWLNRNPIANKWNGFNRHLGGASGTGMALGILAVLGLFSVKKEKTSFSLRVKWDEMTAFFVVIGIVGLIFSLGPRVSFNGIYSEIPLPYHFIVKFVPLLGSLRTTARWAFLLYLAIVYLGVNKLSQINRKSKLAGLLLGTILLLEYIPKPITASSLVYLNASDSTLNQVCGNQPTTILHIPVTHLSASGGIAAGLSYITTRELASLYTKCYLVNGYSGYDMPEIFAIEQQVMTAIETQDSQSIDAIAKASGAKIVVFNTKWIMSNLDFVSKQQILNALPPDKKELKQDEIYYLID